LLAVFFVAGRTSPCRKKSWQTAMLLLAEDRAFDKPKGDDHDVQPLSLLVVFVLTRPFGDCSCDGATKALTSFVAARRRKFSKKTTAHQRKEDPCIQPRFRCIVLTMLLLCYVAMQWLFDVVVRSRLECSNVRHRHQRLT